MCEREGLHTVQVLGTRPRVGKAFFQMLRTRIVPRDFEFTFSTSTKLSYTGFARKPARAD
jgi:2-polyprenyl-6-hydroxyphenyl methylase/3-demethylubiquinone-9 3-methyltransferase